jgi:hypothetical protein
LTRHQQGDDDKDSKLTTNSKLFRLFFGENLFVHSVSPTVRLRSKIDGFEQPFVGKQPQQANLGDPLIGIALE